MAGPGGWERMLDSASVEPATGWLILPRRASKMTACKARVANAAAPEKSRENCLRSPPNVLGGCKRGEIAAKFIRDDGRTALRSANRL